MSQTFNQPLMKPITKDDVTNQSKPKDAAILEFLAEDRKKEENEKQSLQAWIKMRRLLKT